MPTSAKDQYTSDQPVFTIAMISDIQYADAEPFMNRYFRNSLTKLRSFIHAVHQEQISFVIDLGDVIDRDIASFEKVLPIYDQLKFQRYHVLGNHDFQVAEDQKKLIPSILKMPHPYYSFTHANWRFILLDGNDISLHSSLEGTSQRDIAVQWLTHLQHKRALNGNEWNGGIGKTQLNWLENELLEAQKKGQYVIICNHYPVYPPNSHNLWNSQEILDLITSYDIVKAYFSGHNHEGNYGQSHHIHFINVKGMVEDEEGLAYLLLGLYDEELIIKGMGKETNRKLSIS